MTWKPAPSRAPRLVVGISSGSRPGSTTRRRFQKSGMDQHRQVRPTEAADQTVETAGMVEVAVAQDDRLQVAGIDLETAHVLHHPVRADAAVEQQPVGLPRGGHRQQHGEPMLRDELVGAEPAGHGRDRQAAGGRPGAASVGRPLIRHEEVVDVIDERGHGQGVHRLQRDAEVWPMFGVRRRPGWRPAVSGIGSTHDLRSLRSAGGPRNVLGVGRWCTNRPLCATRNRRLVHQSPFATTWPCGGFESHAEMRLLSPGGAV